MKHTFRLMVALGLAAAAGVVLVPANSGSAAQVQDFKINRNSFSDGSSAVVRWNPCQAAITYRVNVSALSPPARAGASRDINSAVNRLANATGINFAYSGTTSFVPTGSSWSRNAPAEVVISYVTPGSGAKSSTLLGSSAGRTVAGSGGYMYKSWTATGSAPWTGAIGRGFVVLNAKQAQLFRPGFGAGVTRGNLVLHELGHVMGLSHVETKSALMYPTIVPRPRAGYQSGDVKGLATLGRRSGCLAVPDWAWSQI